MWHEERLFINGELRDADGGATFDNINPATEEVIGVSADASQQDFDETVAMKIRRLTRIVSTMTLNVLNS